MSKIDDIIKKIMHFNNRKTKEEEEEAIQSLFILMGYAKAFEQALEEAETGGSISHDTLIAIKNSSLDAQKFLYDLASENEKRSKEDKVDKEIDEIINRVGRKRHFNN